MAKTLLPEHESMIQSLAERGDYGNADEVLTEALQLLDQRLRFETLREKIEIGNRDLAAGNSVAWSPELSTERLNVVRVRAAAGDRPHSDVCPPV